MIEFSSQNKYLKHLKELCKNRSRDKRGIFFNSNRKIVDYFTNNVNEILKTGEIYFNKIIPKDKEREKWLYITFLPSNKQNFVDDGSTRLIRELELKFLELLENMKNEEDLIKFSKETGDTRRDFKDILFDDEEDAYYPTESFTFASFMLNAFYDKDIRYKFNKRIQKNNINIYYDELTTQKFKVISYLNNRKIDTKYKAICTRQTDKGECGNEVFFSDIHECSGVKCTDSLQNKEGIESHTIKTSKSMSIETVDLYTYSVKSMSLNEEIIIHSLYKINSSIFEANILCGGIRDETYNLVIAVNEDEQTGYLPEGEEIFLKDKSNVCFLDDMFESIKLYLKKYHNIKVTNKGKIIAHVVMLQLICNKYFQYITQAGIFGTSGGGKSFWSSILPQLFTNSTVTIMGTEVTRNRMLGGQPAKEDIKVLGSFVPGFMATHEYIILEEMSNSINELFLRGKTEQSSKNIFSMLKMAESSLGNFSIPIQGGKSISPSASILFIGNTEDFVNVQKDYRNTVRKHYKSTTHLFNIGWPLYKQIEWYAKEFNNGRGNIELAKAHQRARRELMSKHYVTYLHDAEQSRMSLFVVLEEDNENDYMKIFSKDDSVFNSFVHTQQFIKELKKIFVYGKTATERRSTKLQLSVKKFIEEYINVERNNFKPKHVSKGAQLGEKLSDLSTIYIIANRLWFNKNPTKDEILNTKLTEEEKQLLINKFYIYNYNTLDTKEASMSKKPFINDLPLNDNMMFNEDYAEKEKAEKSINSFDNAEEVQ